MPTVMRFGDYFRQRRKALGLSLREFSRRNGFDPGNISKLERGILAPPRSPLLLESYAKALKLASGAVGREKLFKLAFEEGAAKLPQPPRSKKLSTWIRATMLEQWADYFDAKYTLPGIVRRLVRGTIDPVNLIRTEFPGLESVQSPGWDGIVETTRGNEFVPRGLSVWELSVNKRPQNKMKEDFKKRTKESRGLNKSQATFIFVTPRKWQKKDDWSREKKKSNIWKDVRVYDSEKLEEWLETAKGVDIWLARALGRRPEAAIDIEGHWENLAGSTDPALSPEVFLASREQNIEQFTKWLNSPPSVLAFKSPSPGDVIDFIAAYHACLKKPECTPENKVNPHDLAVRTLIISDKDAWRDISTAPNHLLLLPEPGLPMDGEMITEAVRQGHHVLLCSHRFSAESTQTHDLSRPGRYDLEKALMKMNSGMTEKEASKIARSSGGSLTVMKRAISRFPTTKQPVWSESGNARELIPFVLTGGWDDTHDADQRAIGRLSGKPYEENLQTITFWLNSSDSPVLHVLTNWSLMSREDSWRLLAPSITRQHLDAFEEIAVEVLSEVDPKYELPIKERRYATIDGKALKYSHQIRSGICETLALLGCKSGDGLIQGHIDPPERLAERIIGKLLNGQTSWQQWASLSDLLPVLAEVGPEAFLRAVKDGLRQSEPILRKLFTDLLDNDLFFSSCAHAGLLKALEILAWNPSYLTRVSLLLARLHEIVPQGQGAGSPLPLGSLQHIFLPWRPHTTAPVEQRIKTIRKIVEKYQDAAWKLLLSLMPHGLGFSANTRGPIWRDWSLDWGRVTTNVEYWRQVAAYADCLVSMAGTDITRCSDLINEFDHLPKDAQEQLLDRLERLDLTEVNRENRRKITDSLRKQLDKHRHFPQANQAMPPDMVDKLETLQSRFEPDDLVTRHLWLFALYPRGLDVSWQEREEAVYQAREQALQAIYEAGGLESVLDLAIRSESPRIAGVVYVKSRLYNHDDKIIPDLLNSENEQAKEFAMGNVSALFERKGWDWIETLPLNEWLPEQTGLFLSFLPVERRTWALVEKLGVEVDALYWKRVRGDLRETNKEDVEFAASKLLDYERPLQAIDVLSMALYGKCEIDPDLIMETLEVALNVQNQTSPEDEMVNYDACQIQELFEYLQNRSETDINRLAALEWAYLGFLDDYSRSFPVALQKTLQQDPQFFCQLISVVYRSDNEPEDEGEAPTEQEKARARNAYNLLTRWNAIPGTGDDGVIDEQILMDWVDKAREICKESGHLSVCDIHIGEMLAREPGNSDDEWPGIPVRDVIDEIDSDDLVRGFEIGIYNKRGVYSGNRHGGGLQERALAEKFNNFASQCETDWPETAASLRRVAKHYEDEAKREDERVNHRV